MRMFVLVLAAVWFHPLLPSLERNGQPASVLTRPASVLTRVSRVLMSALARPRFGTPRR